MLSRETSISHPDNPKRPRWQRILRFWRHRAYRRRVLLLCTAGLPLLAALVTLGIFYRHYSNVIDAQLRGGPFQDSMTIYGSAFVLNQADGISLGDLEAELKMAGYAEAGTQKPATWRVAAGGLDVFPVRGSSDAPVHISTGPAGIARLTVSGRAVESYTLGYPLIANLSAARDKRQIVTFNQIPPVLVQAVVSAEDKHFFKHRGVDLPRVAKAAWVDFSEGRKAQGASTLTMQLVRGLWLVPEKRWKRKMAEALMTIHLERTWSKEQIFETYASQVYMGREAAYSIHGFAEGARIYFGKDLKAISLPEAALLAGMVQRPSYFNPVRNPERAKERRDLVLLLMKENKYIGEDQYQAAVDSPLGAAAHFGSTDIFGASYFLDQVTDELQGTAGSDENVRDVYTTIDMNLQRAATEAITAGMREVDKLLAKSKDHAGKHAEAALIAIDPHTGEIKAMIGGRDYAASQLNRLFSKRPPGSVFKPFVYAAALNTAIEGGRKVFTAASTVDDSPATFRFGGKSYQPANFHDEHFGMLTLRQALAHSDNVAAVKIAEAVGYDSVVAMARRAGLNGNIKPTPAVALGSYDVTPLEIAGAYTAFANGGIVVKPQMVSSVRDTAGEMVRNFQPESHQAIDPRLAYLMTSMLEEVMRSGTAASVRSRGFTLPAAGKTGTSHDGWFAGYTSQLLCVVWVGFDDYSELNLEGAKSALPIWTEFMKRAAKFGAYRNAKEFAAPGGVVTSRICVESGKLAGPLCPDTRSELFIAGSDPQQNCDLHTLEAASNQADPVGASSSGVITPPEPAAVATTGGSAAAPH